MTKNIELYHNIIIIIIFFLDIPVNLKRKEKALAVTNLSLQLECLVLTVSMLALAIENTVGLNEVVEHVLLVLCLWALGLKKKKSSTGDFNKT